MCALVNAFVYNKKCKIKNSSKEIKIDKVILNLV